MTDFKAGFVQILAVGDVVGVCGKCELRTTLGTCVAVCLRDPVAGVGGMNHYALARCDVNCQSPGRYGDEALPMLLEECLSMGAVQKRLVAKVAGGGIVRPDSTNCVALAKANVDYAAKFLDRNNIPIVAQDTGGKHARSVRFDTETGTMMVRRFDVNRRAENPAESARALVLTANRSIGIKEQ